MLLKNHTEGATRLSPTERHRRKGVTQARVAPEARKAAREARLHYVNDDEPGYSRKRNGRGFVYFDQHGRRIRAQATLRRLASLAIPPAYTDVWICLHENGHIQATGRDARGRKQYRYHPRWREVRDE